MKKFLFIALAMALILTVGGLAAAEEPDKGGSLVVSQPAEPPGLDPTSNTAAAIESPSLRERSEERLKTTKASYAEIGDVGAKAADMYGPFMKALQDQITYLASDLNPQSIASLKPDATKLNERADELIKSIDNTIYTANTNIGALRPQ